VNVRSCFWLLKHDVQQECSQLGQLVNARTRVKSAVLQTNARRILMTIAK